MHVEQIEQMDEGNTPDKLCQDSRHIHGTINYVDKKEKKVTTNLSHKLEKPPLKVNCLFFNES